MIELPLRWRDLASDPVRVLSLQQLGSRLRERLSQTLPDYMVPAHFTVLEKLPLTANGKLDRKALPEPELHPSGNYEAPQGEIEAALAAIWSEVLGVERIGRHDNFFELGGHSLLMAKVLARAREQSELLGEIKLADMMQQPTISALIRRNVTRRLSHPLIRLNAPGQTPPLFCIHQTGGVVFSYFSLARALNGRRTVFGVSCRSHIDFSHRDVSVLQMARDYAALIREQRPAGPHLLLGHSSGGLLASWIASVLEAEGCTVAFLGLVDAFVPAATARTPLEDTRASLIGFLSQFIPHDTLEHAFLRDVELGPTESMRSNEPLIEAVKKIARKERHASLDMSAEEMVEAYVIHRRMLHITLGSPPLTALQVAPHCWWAAERPASDRDALRQQVGRLAMEWEVNADHSSILDSPEFVAHGVQVISSVGVTY